MAKGDQNTRNESVTLAAATNTQLTPVVGRGLRRTQILITNTGANVLYVTKGINAATAGVGIPLQPNGTFIEADDAGFRMWQQNIMAISTGGSTVAIAETFEEL